MHLGSRSVLSLYNLLLVSIAWSKLFKVVESQTTVDCFPKFIKSLKGSHSTDQAVSVLRTNELTGTQDKWDTYIEFSSNSLNYIGLIKVKPTSSYNKSLVSKLQFAVNMKGPQFSYQSWTFKIRNAKTKKWELLVNNKTASSWIWTMRSKTISMTDIKTVNDYLVNGVFIVRLFSNNSKDAFNLDYLNIKLILQDAPSPTPPTPTPPSPTPNGGGTNLISVLDTFTYDLASVLSSYSTKVVAIDLFDTTTAKIQNLKNQNKVVICYFSAGSYENWRPDKNEFQASVLGNNMDGWAGEKWVDTRAQSLRTIMSNRIELAKSKGCDGVDPDNVDGYSNNTGFPLTKQDSIDYLTFLSTEAHTQGLVIGLKNSPGLVANLVSKFDFAVVEECYKYNECCMYFPFVNNDKAVLAIEYPKYKGWLCTPFKNHKFSIMFGTYSLNKLYFCPSNIFNRRTLRNQFETLIDQRRLDAWNSCN